MNHIVLEDKEITLMLNQNDVLVPQRLFDYYSSLSQESKNEFVMALIAKVMMNKMIKH